MGVEGMTTMPSDTADRKGMKFYHNLRAFGPSVLQIPIMFFHNSIKIVGRLFARTPRKARRRHPNVARKVPGEMALAGKTALVGNLGKR